MKRAGKWPAAWLTVSLTALLGTGCGGTPVRERTMMTDVGRASHGDALLRRIGLTLPPGARIEHADAIAGRDDAARLIAVMSEGDERGFEAELRKHASGDLAFSADRNAFLAPDDDDWRPSKAAGLKTVQVPWRQGRETLNIGVASTGGHQVRLFLFWHQN